MIVESNCIFQQLKLTVVGSWAAPAALDCSLAAPAALHLSWAAPAALHCSWAAPAALHCSWAAPAAPHYSFNFHALRTSSPSSVGQDAELDQVSSCLCILANPLPLSITDLGQCNVLNVRLFEDLARGADSFLQRLPEVGGGGRVQFGHWMLQIELNFHAVPKEHISLFFSQSFSFAKHGTWPVSGIILFGHFHIPIAFGVALWDMSIFLFKVSGRMPLFLNAFSFIQ